ncbi:MAG: hypothetical protein ACQEQO_11410 [Thermodesulfobacteriota bacterium]
MFQKNVKEVRKAAGTDVKNALRLALVFISGKNITICINPDRRNEMKGA